MIFDRTKDASGVWHYADPNEAEFAWSIWSTTGLQIEAVDSFLEGLESDCLTDDMRSALIEERGKAMDAYRSGDFELSKAMVIALCRSCEYAGLHFISVPLARIGKKVKEGPNNRHDAHDKPEFIRIIRDLYKSLPEPPTTVRAWRMLDQIAPYARKYKGKHTLRDWINEALPGTLKTGAPKKDTVI